MGKARKLSQNTLNSFEIEFTEKRSVGAHLELSELNLEDLVKKLRIKRAGRGLFKGVPHKEVREIALEAVGELAGSEHIVPALEATERRIKGANPAKQLLFFKILERAALVSREEEVWRSIIKTISNPVYQQASPKEGDWRALLSIRTLSNLEKRANLEEKKRLVHQCIAGAIFCYNTRVALNSLKLVAGVGGPLSLASLVALAGRPNNSREVSSAALNELFLMGVALGGEKNAGRGALALPNGSGGELLAPIMLEGFEDILSVNGITLPHPWYLERAKVFPIPRFDEGGIQLSSFSQLGRMDSVEALMCSISAFNQLVSPHISGMEGRIEGEISVRSALGALAASFRNLLEQQKIESAGELGSFLMGQPKLLQVQSIEEAALWNISPILCQMINSAQDMGVSDSIIPKRAEAGLGRVLVSGIEEVRNSDCAARRVVANLMKVRVRCDRLLGVEPEGKRIQFLSKVAKDRIKALPKQKTILRLPRKK